MKTNNSVLQNEGTNLSEEWTASSAKINSRRRFLKLRSIALWSALLGSCVNKTVWAIWWAIEGLGGCESERVNLTDEKFVINWNQLSVDFIAKLEDCDKWNIHVETKIWRSPSVFDIDFETTSINWNDPKEISEKFNLPDDRCWVEVTIYVDANDWKPENRRKLSKKTLEFCDIPAWWTSETDTSTDTDTWWTTPDTSNENSCVDFKTPKTIYQTYNGDDKKYFNVEFPINPDGATHEVDVSITLDPQLTFQTNTDWKITVWWFTPIWDIDLNTDANWSQVASFKTRLWWTDNTVCTKYGHIEWPNGTRTKITVSDECWVTTKTLAR